MLRRVLNRVSNSQTLGGLVALLERLDRQRPNLLRVLTYHRVDYRASHPELDGGLISATPEVFRAQVEYLAANYRPVSVIRVLEAIRGNGPLPPRAVLLTFDDAYRDFAEHAWPVLKRLHIPATLFVPTGYPDQPGMTFWWDRLHQAIHCSAVRTSVETPLGSLSLESPGDRDRAFRRLKARIKSLPHRVAMAWMDVLAARLGSPPPFHHVLGWTELRRLASEGVSLGAHTRTHPLLGRIAPTAAAAEAIAARHDLEQQIGSSLPIFAYPGGECNDTVAKAIQDAGFELAFTTTRGINNLHDADPLRLRRINVGARTTQPVLRAQLLPWSTHLKRWT